MNLTKFDKTKFLNYASTIHGVYLKTVLQIILANYPTITIADDTPKPVPCTPFALTVSPSFHVRMFYHEQGYVLEVITFGIRTRVVTKLYTNVIDMMAYLIIRLKQENVYGTHKIALADIKVAYSNVNLSEKPSENPALDASNSIQAVVQINQPVLDLDLVSIEEALTAFGKVAEVVSTNIDIDLSESTYDSMYAQPVDAWVVVEITCRMLNFVVASKGIVDLAKTIATKYKLAIKVDGVTV